MRHHVLALGLRVYVRAGHAMDRNDRVYAPWIAPNLHDHWCTTTGLLGIPVCIRRYLFDGHLGRDDRSLRFHWRLAVQRRGDRVHLSDHWPLGLGARWLARQYDA